MTKAEMIEKYGIEYYEDFKAKSRARMKKLYHADIELARKSERNIGETAKRQKHTSKHTEKSIVLVAVIGTDSSTRVILLMAWKYIILNITGTTMTRIGWMILLSCQERNTGNGILTIQSFGQKTT